MVSSRIFLTKKTFKNLKLYRFENIRNKQYILIINYEHLSKKYDENSVKKPTSFNYEIRFKKYGGNSST